MDFPPRPLPGLERGGPSNLPTLQGYAPGNARMTALVRIDRLRGTPYQEILQRILQVVPDHRILLQATGLDPITFFDSLFYASAAPRYVQETFLAVRHRLTDEQLRAALALRFAEDVPWEPYGGYALRALAPPSSSYRDPRRILLARPGLAVLLRPEWLEWLTAPLPAGSPLAEGDGGAPGISPVIATPPTTEPVVAEGPSGAVGAPAGPGEEEFGPPQPPTPLDGLVVLDDAAAAEQTMLLLSARGLAFFAPGVGRLPRFEAVRLKISEPQAPLLTIDLQFANATLAARFAHACPRLSRRIAAAIPLGRVLGLEQLIGRLRCLVSEQYMTITGRYTEDEVIDLLTLALPFIPQPQLAGLPAPPPLPAAEPSSAGSGTKAEPDAGGSPPLPAAEPSSGSKAEPKAERSGDGTGS